MTKYAYYDSTILPNDQVIGWIDSEIEKNMPPIKNLLEMTDDQWINRTSNIYYVIDGVLTNSGSILFVVQNKKKDELYSKCSKEIISGFESNALGNKNLYASTTIDQMNIMIATQSTNGGLLSYIDENGSWQKTIHTQLQSKQVFEDMSSNINTCRMKLRNLISEVSSTNNIDAVEKISW